MSDAKPTPALPMDEILAKIRRIIAEDEEAADQGAAEPDHAASAAPPAPAASGSGKPDDEDVLELTDAIDDDGTVTHLPPRGRSPETPAAAAAPPSGQGAAAPEPRLVAAAPILEPAAADPTLAERREPRLGDARPPGSRTLDDIACELLRPLLRSWLDDNLPALVERLTREELARRADKPDAA